MASGTLQGLQRAAETVNAVHNVAEAGNRVYAAGAGAYARMNPMFPSWWSRSGKGGIDSSNYVRRNATRAAGTRAGVGRSNVGLWQGRLAGAREELKFHDVIDEEVLTATVSSAFSTPLLTVASGSGESLRTGRKINLRSIALRFSVSYDATQTLSGYMPQDDIVRVLVIQDRQANGTTPNLSDILEYPGGSNPVFAFNNLSNKNRFRILMDKTIELVYHNAFVDDPSFFGFFGPQKAASWYKKCNIPIEYSGATGTVGEIKSNNLLMVVIRKESTPGGFRFRFNARVRFTD